MFCSKCGTQIADGALFCFKCGNKTQTESAGELTVSNTQAIQTVNSDVKEYLEHAKSLEVNRYTLQKTIGKIERKIGTLGHAKKFGPRKCAAPKEFLLPCFIVIFLGSLIGILTSNEDLAWWLVMSGIAVLVGFIWWCVKDDRYYKEYNHLVDDDKERVKREKQQIVELRNQQDDLRAQINDISGVLEKLYSLNVVYPKYREMIPVITMWEYLDSGRCTDLSGANGAYNLYESESRQNIIISNLNQAVSMLAQIRDNQFALYEAIEESNAIAEQMCYQNESLISANKSIAQNSEIAAYNSKLAADNSSVSAYIDFCKF